MPRKKSLRISEDDAFSKETRKAIQAKGLSQARPHGLRGEGPYRSCDDLDSLVGTVFFDEGIIIRITPDREGKIWSKACIRTGEFPRHYLLTCHPPGSPLSRCLVDLAEKVQLFQEGALKPSPDKWD